VDIAIVSGRGPELARFTIRRRQRNFTAGTES
jgi:hypothetical protein